VIDRLTARFCETVKTPGDYHDGRGLCLQVRKSESGDGRITKSWVLRYTALAPKPDGRRQWRYMGLGSYADIPLAKARQKAADAREQLRNCIDPIDHRNARKAALIAKAARTVTCDVAFARCVADREAEWKSAGSKRQWEQSWRAYVKPVIGDMPIDQVNTDEVLRILRPIWKTLKVADRVRNRLERVLGYAGTHGWRSLDNPARWAKHLENILPSPTRLHQKKHHAAVPVDDMPAFMMRLHALHDPAAAALELAVLTVARSASALGCQWEEIDWQKEIWTVPGERMKSKKADIKPHQVPLSKAALAVLKARKPPDDARGLVFTKHARALSRNAFVNLLRSMKVDATAHGMRAAFATWCQDHNRAAAEVREACLAHSSSAVEAAYARGNMIQRRRELLEHWAAYLEQRPAPDNVRELPKRRA